MPTEWHHGYPRRSRRPAHPRCGTLAGVAANTNRYTEVERKFDVLESTVSPSFDGLALVARIERTPSHTLDAVYYDTPGRDLAGRRIRTQDPKTSKEDGQTPNFRCGTRERSDNRVDYTDALGMQVD